MYTKTDRMGTYCLVDMELWLDALKVPVNNSISEKMEVNENRVALQNSLDIDINSIYNENKVNSSSNEELRDGFNLVFVIDTCSTKTYDEFKLMKNRILDISRTVLRNSPNARIYFMSQNTSLTSDEHYYFYSDLYAESTEDKNGNKLRCNYFTDYAHIEKVLKTVTCTQSDISKIVLSDALEGINAECDLTRETFVFSIFNQDNVMYRYSNGYDILDDVVAKGVDISVIAEIDNSKKYGYAHDMYKKSGGKLFSDQYDYTEDVIEHIYGKKVNKAEEDAGEYWMILSTGLEYVKLDDTVSNIYFNHDKKGIEQTDTDKDGLSDYEEINFECGLIKINNGLVTLPTYGECIDYKAELLYVERGLYRYEKELIKDGYLVNWIKTNVNVLPINSDPTDEDGDGDGLLDGAAQYYGNKIIAPQDKEPLKANGPLGVWQKYIKEISSPEVPHLYGDTYMDIDWHNFFSNGLLKSPIATIAGAHILTFDFDEKHMALHAHPFTWQWLGGYTDFYDDVFEWATGGNMDKLKLQFTNEKNELYYLWCWRGDYINLGSGAEIGIYKKSFIPGEAYATFTLPMTLSLYNYTENGIDTIFNWAPDEKQWWVTGWNPEYMKPNKFEMVMLGSVDFTGHKDMFDSLIESTQKDSDKLVYDEESLTVWIIWHDIIQ